MSLLRDPRRLGAHGLSVAVPPGCDARIEQRAEGPVPAPGSESPMSGHVHPVLHVATSTLPVGRGDYGSGYVERMRADDVLVCLAEFDHEAGDTAMFADGRPTQLRSADFHPDAQQRVIEGMCGTQRFFTEGGRAFCLYVVLGSWIRRQNLVPVANSLIAGIRIEPR